MNPRASFQWLPVTTLPDGTDLRLPLHTLQGAHPGPTLGLSCALHGDEMLPGVGVLRRLLEEIEPAELKGTIMAVPICNPLGVAERSRHTPGDGMNLNVAFHDPGHSEHVEPVKGVTEQIADVLRDGFLSHLNYLIDFHSGGETHAVHMLEFPDNPVSFGMARAFGLSLMLRTVFNPGRMWTMAVSKGASVIVAQLGGGGFLFDEWVDRGVQGTLNVMRHLGMLPGQVKPPPRQRVVSITPGHEKDLTMLRPREGGLIVPDPKTNAKTAFDGQPVEGVPVLGRLLNPYDLTVRQTFEAPFSRTLMLASVIAPVWTYPGETAYMLADADKAEVVD
jgi:predicted deacylase